MKNHRRIIKRPSMKNIFVVIPAYNEEKKIADVVKDVRDRVENVIVVDDGSADRTQGEAESSGAVVLRHIINRGQGAALRTGIKYALLKGAEIIVTFDADGQFQTEEISKIIQPVQEGRAEVVLGSRFLGIKSNIPFIRFVILKAGLIFTRLISGIKVTDTHNGFRALSRAAALEIKITEDEWAHASEIIDEISSKKISFVEVPVTVRYTNYSMSKTNSSLNSIKIALRIFWSKLLK